VAQIHLQGIAGVKGDQARGTIHSMKSIPLPPPSLAGSLSLEEALQSRRTRRDFTGAALDLAELGQVLWATHGITGQDGRRTAPSAGFTDPLEVYAVTGAGAYRYDAKAHQLEVVSDQDLRPALDAATKDDGRLNTAGAVIAITAVFSRTEERYGSRAMFYVTLGAGHAAQNALLQVEVLGLAAYPVGGFDPDRTIDALGLGEGYIALYLIPVGRRV
jgi:SagB-type dehydrogenase family enzyme